MRFLRPNKSNECGVTILIVGLTLLALVAMAALVIDVASLYQAQAEAQRAADAAALAGANIFATSGFTSYPGNFTAGTICHDGAAQTAAVNKQAEAAAHENLISGQPATIKSVTCILGNVHNPRVQITVVSSTLPTFFARIWGPNANTVTATATAEAYNPSGGATPVDVRGVKPWLVPNCDPTHPTPANPNCTSGAYFINPATGQIANGGSFVGKEFCFSRIGRSGPSPLDPSPLTDPDCPNGVLRFYSMNLPFDSTLSECPSTDNPSCGSVGSDTFVDNVACASSFVFRCNQTIGPPGAIVSVDLPFSYGVGTRAGGKCLIHATGFELGQGQDVFTPGGSDGLPLSIEGGDNNPNSTLHTTNISRSDSIVTVPLYDGTDLCPGGIVRGTCPGGATALPAGFMQLAITRIMDFPTDKHFEAIVTNVTGCPPSPSGTPLQAGVASPIAVRLVQNP